MAGCTPLPVVLGVDIPLTWSVVCPLTPSHGVWKGFQCAIGVECPVARRVAISGGRPVARIARMSLLPPCGEVSALSTGA